LQKIVLSVFKCVRYWDT